MPRRVMSLLRNPAPLDRGHHNKCNEPPSWLVRLDCQAKKPRSPEFQLRAYVVPEPRIPIRGPELGHARARRQTPM